MFAYGMLLKFVSGLVYCMDYLEKNIDWLEEKLKPLIEGWYRLAFFIKTISMSCSLEDL